MTIARRSVRGLPVYASQLPEYSATWQTFRPYQSPFPRPLRFRSALMISRLTHSIWVNLLRLWPDNLVVLDRAALLHGCRPADLTNQQKIDYTYRVLTILDDKAQSLMQFNAFVIALVALFWPIVSTKSGAMLIAAAMTIGTSIVSIMASLFVVGVFWRFLAIAVPSTSAQNSATSANVPDSFSTEISNLCKVVGMRESAYQLAWAASLVSLLSLIPIFYGALT